MGVKANLGYLVATHFYSFKDLFKIIRIWLLAFRGCVCLCVYVCKIDIVDFIFLDGFFLQLLRKSILQRGKPVVEGSLEKKPPFEKPSIEQVKRLLKG